MLKPELAAVLGAERFVQEIKTTASLQHPHILPLFDSGEADGFLYYVMPYIEGETLRDKLDRETQLGIDEAVRITTEVADALDYAHRQGVIHRDIKPENILLHDGRPMVADFGIALAVSAAAGGRMTETGLSLGTPHYMSPEQATAEKDITSRSDIYSLGAVTYEMLTGEPPHMGNSAQAIIMKIVTEEAQPVTRLRKSVPTNVTAAVSIALEKLPADRFSSAAEFSEALTNPAFSLSASAASPGGSPLRRSIATPALAAVAILAAALAAWGWLRPRPAPAGRVARYFVLASDSVRIRSASAALNMAIAPDGSRFAFVSERGPGLLWVRRMEDLRPQPLPGTEGARWPTFSPDGQWIAFVKTPGSQLQKIRVDGGATVTIADSVASFGYGGLAWLDDNTLVFTNLVLGLRRVSAAGGAVSELLTPETGGGAGSATPLPGGRGVIYQSCTTNCVTTELRVLDLGTGETKPLVADANRGWYLPTGDLLYVRSDGAALAAPFDLRTLAVTGSPIPVLDNVQMPSFFPELAVADDGTLLYVSGAGTAGPIVRFVRVDQAGRATPIDTAWSGPFGLFALSLDGGRMAVTVGAGAGRDIWIKQLDRGPFTRFTFSGLDRGPTWSPDGRMVAFARDTLAGNDIYAKPADGSGEDHVIGHIDRLVQTVEWSADGNWLLIRTDNTDIGRGDIFGIHLAGDTTPVPLVASPYEELHPTLAPDGRWLAYTSSESGEAEVYVRPFPATSEARWQVSIGGGSHPRWAPNSRALYYLSGEPRRMMAADLAPGSGFSVADRKALFELDPAFQVNYYHTSYGLTPDGNSFVFLSESSTDVRQTREERLVLVENWFTELRELMESQ